MLFELSPPLFNSNSGHGPAFRRQVARLLTVFESPLRISPVQRMAGAGIARPHWPSVSVAAVTPPRYFLRKYYVVTVVCGSECLMTEMFQPFYESPFGSFRVEGIEVVLAQVAVHDRLADEVISDHD